MADLEDRHAGDWLWWLAALLAVIGLAWWAWPAGNQRYLAEANGGEPAAVLAPAGGASDGQRGITIADIAENPARYVGWAFSPLVRVVGVPTDRGFWVEEDGKRLFVVLLARPRHPRVHVQANTTLRLNRAVVRDTGYLGRLPGMPLDSATEEIARSQPAFLTVRESYVQVTGENVL